MEAAKSKYAAKVARRRANSEAAEAYDQMVEEMDEYCNTMAAVCDWCARTTAKIDSMREKLEQAGDGQRPYRHAHCRDLRGMLGAAKTKLASICSRATHAKKELP